MMIITSKKKCDRVDHAKGCNLLATPPARNKIISQMMGKDDLRGFGRSLLEPLRR
jgi:hypothetical protein